MSLLLDALKRAEQEKQLSRGAEPSREPVTPLAATHSPSPASLELQPLGGTAAPSPSGVPPRSEAAAHAAQAVFQAKQPPADSAKRGRGVIWAALGVVAVVVAAAGAYVWSQVRSLTPAAPLAYSAKRPPPAPIAQPASAAPHVDMPPPAAATVRPVTTPAPTPAPPPLQAPVQAAAATTPSASQAARDDALVAQVTQALQQNATKPAAPPVELARSTPALRIAPDVASGYEALRAGDLPTARRAYQAALAGDSRNLDALLGAATTEARGGNRPAAVALYRRALEVDPRNATALAGMAALADALPADQVEAQLRQDLSRAPNNAALHFALGNLYAGHRRWNDAQAAFFEAFRLEPANADTCFTLAVTLDQLGKGKLAAQFYRRALEAARGQPAQFDPAAATRRAAELEAAAGR